MITADLTPEHPVTITLAEPGQDRELKAIAYIASVLNEFSAVEQARIIGYLRRRLGFPP